MKHVLSKTGRCWHWLRFYNGYTEDYIRVEYKRGEWRILRLSLN